MPIENIPSVLKYGILSHNQIGEKKLQNSSVAMREIQERRDNICIPNGMRLHNYANLYFDARNPMMFKLKSNNRHHEICVLEIDQAILQETNVIISDRNASSAYTKFSESIENIAFEKIYAKYWKPQGHSSDCRCLDCHENKSIKCAEVLVPYRVDPSFFVGAHVANESAKQKLQEKGFGSKIFLTPDLFFC